MFGTLPYDSPLPNQVKLNYPPIQQARQIAVNRTIKHHKINKQSASSSRVRKRVSKGNFPRLEQCLVSWMRQCQGQNIPMGESLLKEKAKALAKELEIEFSASEG
ncbi:hypothetical protein TNCV_2727841 [Trichonephila clavipes]|nr:hypothetical protein TNCV_2727841 [Trichonephila clavipes]